MPKLKNYTPFRNFRYYSLDNEGNELGVVIVKATYRLTSDGQLIQDEEQAPLVFTDLCHGALNETSLQHPSDLVPHKPVGEVLVNAIAHAPGGEPLPDWLCGITVDGGDGCHIEKGLRVTGERFWRPTWDPELDEEERAEWRDHRSRFQGWELTEPEPTVAVPLRWEHAYGGLLDRGPDEDGQPRIETNEHNPLGVGWIDEEATDHTEPVPAPRIEDPMTPVTDPYAELEPQNLGPIPPAWLPRRPLGGTYDQHWIDHVWPNWPADYDFAYHLSSPAWLRWPTFFSGRERISLRNLLPGGGVVQVALPRLSVQAHLIPWVGPGEPRNLDLDTIFFDLAHEAEADRRVYLVWRTRFAPDTYRRIELRVLQARERAA